MPITLTALLRQAIAPFQSVFSAAPQPARPSVTPLASVVPATAPRRPLRVLRVRDAGAGGRTADRMVISGSIADVCAELERLAA